MRNLTNSEMLAVGGAETSASTYSVNWWRAGFDVSAGAAGGAALGAVGFGLKGLFSTQTHPLVNILAGLYGFGMGGAIGMGVGAATGAVLASAREVWNYSNS